MTGERSTGFGSVLVAVVFVMRRASCSTAASASARRSIATDGAFAPRHARRSAGEPRLNCHPRRGGPVADAELGEDVAQVPIGGAFADEEPLGELLVGEAVGQCGQHLSFSSAEGREW